MVLKLALPFSAVLETQHLELQAALKSFIFPYILLLFVLNYFSNSVAIVAAILVLFA